jgi:hypothetical protein
MAKDFKNSIGRKRLNTLIPDNDPAPQSGIEVINKVAPSSNKVNPSPTPPETVVSTFRINSEKLKTIKAIAFWDRKKIQEVFDEALALYIEAQPKTTINKAVEEYTKRTQ